MLTSLPNIGEKLQEQLKFIGINCIEDLRSAGSRAAWLMILSIDHSACFMRLCALEGAIRGVRWHNLDPIVKAELKSFYQEAKGK
ncbi:competence protein TfoX [bacterium]|nr:competence protein TfoX [bacterium]